MIRYTNFSNSNIGNQPKPFPPKMYQPPILQKLQQNEMGIGQSQIPTNENPDIKMYNGPNPSVSGVPSFSTFPNLPQQATSANYTQIPKTSEVFPKVSSEITSSNPSNENIRPPVAEICIKSTSQQNIEEENYKRANSEFENMVRDKIGKIDEIMVTLKDLAEKKQFTQQSLPPQENQITVHQPVAVKPTVQATKRVKRSYYPIPENRWNELKVTFPELQETHKNIVFSDGEKNYIELKNKKVELNYKAILKLLAK